MLTKKGKTMTIAVISTNVSCDSAKLLAKALKGTFINMTHTDKRAFPEFTHIFKYGFSPKIAANYVFNKSKPTSIAIDKIETLSLFQENGPAIKFTTKLNTALQWIEQGYIVVARAQIKGANGDGLAYCYTAEEVRNTPAKFWSQYVEHTNEFRINVWRGKVVSIYDKIQLPTGRFSFKLWQGQEKHPQLVALVDKVWRAVKLDWCGIDVIRDQQGNLLLLEVNSAPVLYPVTLKKLVKCVKEAMNENTP
jgi:glutathione synthase/RimK-type ligase-like ATP-grasp enzyme